MNLIDFIPGGRTVQLIVLAVLAAALLGGITYAVHSYNESLRAEGRAEIQQKWDADVRRQQAQAIADAAVSAQETKRRLERQGDAQREQQAELARYRRADTDSRAAAVGMQSRIAELTAAANRGTSDSATADERKAGAAATGVLADVLGRTDAAAELYARTADSARRAGLLCERTYDALTPAKGLP